MELFANYVTTDQAPAEWARAREDEGWDGVTASDHFWVSGAAFPHLWVSLTAMACATERVVLASSFANNLMRSPVEFAQASLSLQRVAEGRFEAGLGAGWAADEMRRTGQAYPPGPERAARYREAMAIARELLARRACRFRGAHYDVDVPPLGGEVDVPPPPLVGSVGGPRTIREISPLVDRVELKFGRSTRGGALDLAALASVTEDELSGMVAAVRAVAPEVPIGLFALCAVGTGPAVERLSGALGDNLVGGFVGAPDEVAANLCALERLGVSRLQLTQLVPGSVEALAPALLTARRPPAV